MAKSHLLFLRKVPSEMFDRALNTPPATTSFHSTSNMPRLRALLASRIYVLTCLLAFTSYVSSFFYVRYHFFTCFTCLPPFTCLTCFPSSSYVIYVPSLFYVPYLLSSFYMPNVPSFFYVSYVPSLFYVCPIFNVLYVTWICEVHKKMETGKK